MLFSLSLDASPSRRTMIRWIRRHRRIMAACLAALAVLFIMIGRTEANPTTPIVVAKQDILAGASLTNADLTTINMPAELVPAGSHTDTDQVVGKITTTPVAAMELVTINRLVGSRPQARAGEVLVPVRLADAGAAGLLAPGDIVNVIAATVDGQARVIAHNARVVTRPIPPAGFSTQTGSLVLLSVSGNEAIELAASSTQRALTAVLQ
ncbi:MAG: SAF domain-containing protein [Candidatus Nanopelagicales bacterium]